MSGLEVLGGLASASQLFQYTSTLVITLYQLYRNVEHSEERYGQYKAQIDQIIQIAKLVQSLEEVLRTEIVTAHIRALLKTTESISGALEEGCVGDISKKWRRCLKAFQWHKAEEAILKGFADLERDKSCLTLCILGTYGAFISRIDRNVGEGIPQLQGQVGKLERSLSDCSEIAKEGFRIRSDPCFFHKHFCSIRTCKKMHKENRDNNQLVILGARAMQKKPNEQPGDNCPPAPNTDRCSDSLSDSAVLIERPRFRDAESDSGYGTLAEDTISEDTLVHEPPPPIRSWSDNMVCDEALQINGNVGKKPAADEPFKRCHWNSNEARNQSKQVNGDILDAEFAAIFFARRPAYTKAH